MAEAAKPGLKDDVVTEKFLSCSICLETFNNPKLLPCQHTFCLQCLDSYIRKTSTDGEFLCPCCRTGTKLPPNGATEFKTNYFINKLLTFFCGEDTENMCCVCTLSSKTSTGAFRCVDCSDVLCQACSSVHQQTRLTHNHSVIPLDKLNSQANIVETDDAVPCSEHPEKNVTCYCNSCEKSVCTDCKASTHWQHKISTFFAAAKSRKPKLLEKTHGFKEKYKNAETTLMDLEKYREEVTCEYDLLTEEVERLAEMMHTAVSTLKFQVLQQAGKMAKQILKVNKAAVDQSQTILAQLSTHQENLMKAVERGTDVGILEAINMPNNPSSIELTEMDRSQNPTLGQYKFANGGMKKTFLVGCQKSLEYVEKSVRLEPKQGVLNRELKFVKKLPNPVKDCKCTSIVQSEEGTLYACCQGQVYRYAGKWELLSCNMNIRNAFDLAVDGNIVISITASTKYVVDCTVVFYDTVDRFTEVIHLKVFEKSPRICFARQSSFLYITAPSQNTIVKLNIADSVLKKWTDLDGRCPSSIIECKNGNILVSCSSCICELNERLENVRCIDTTSISQNPMCIVSDYVGNIYGAIEAQDSVCIMSSDGVFSKAVLCSHDGISMPVCLSITRDHLAVAHTHGVWVYSLD